MFNRQSFNELKFNQSTITFTGYAYLPVITSTSAKGSWITPGSANLQSTTSILASCRRIRYADVTCSGITRAAGVAVRARLVVVSQHAYTSLQANFIRTREAASSTHGVTGSIVSGGVILDFTAHITSNTRQSSYAVRARVTSMGLQVITNIQAASLRIRKSSSAGSVVTSEVAADIRVRYATAQNSIRTNSNASASSIKSTGSHLSTTTQQMVQYQRLRFDSAHPSALGVTTTSGRAERHGSAELTADTHVAADLVPGETYFFNQPMRHITSYVKVYFDGDTETPVTIGSDTYLASLDLLEEMSAESNNPLGAISSNVLDLEFVNANNRFSPYNVDGPYYGKLVPNIKVEAYLQIKRDNDQFVDIPLGTFRTGSWDGTSDSYSANVSCYDKLYFMLQDQMSLFKARQSASLYSLFEDVFTSCGLTSSDYIIDSSLSSVIVPTAWLPKGTVKAVLTYLAQAARAFVYVNKSNKLVVHVLSLNSTLPTFKLTDTQQVISVDVPADYDKVYSRVIINNYNISVTAEGQVLAASVVIPNGTASLGTMDLSKGPVPYISYTNVENSAIDVRVKDYTAWTVQMEATNGGTQETAAIEVYAPTLEQAVTPVTVNDASAIAIVGTKVLTIDNSLIQNGTYASDYAAALLSIVANPKAKAIVSIRGNPKIKLGDIVYIDDPSDALPPKTIIVSRSKLSYSGGLEGQLEGYVIP